MNIIFSVSYHLVILLTVLAGHSLCGCGSPEVKVDEIKVDYDEKNVDRSKNETTTNTINYGASKEPEEVEEGSIEEAPEIDMSFQIEMEKIVIAPENFNNKYKLHIFNHNHEHTAGFRVRYSYHNLPSANPSPIRAYYDISANTNCESNNNQMSRLRWIDVIAVNNEGKESYKVRYEVPFEDTWCYTSQL